MIQALSAQHSIQPLQRVHSVQSLQLMLRAIHQPHWVWHFVQARLALVLPSWQGHQRAKAG
jgi:hypothetical protein